MSNANRNKKKIGVNENQTCFNFCSLNVNVQVVIRFFALLGGRKYEKPLKICQQPMIAIISHLFYTYKRII